MPCINSRIYYGRDELRGKAEQVVEGTSKGAAAAADQAWEAMYDQLLKYKDEYGDCCVPRNFKDNPKLGRWINKQRSQKMSMPAKRRDKLDSINFAWSVQKHEEWDTMYAKLESYRQAHGNCLVPQKYKLDKKLGKWVDNQRTFFKTGHLSEERKERLDAIGFSWKVVETWDEMFQRLVEYKKAHGHVLVPQSTPRLGNWVRLQRVRKSTRTAEQKKKLRSIGFVWNARKESWKDAY